MGDNASTGTVPNSDHGSDTYAGLGNPRTTIKRLDDGVCTICHSLRPPLGKTRLYLIITESVWHQWPHSTEDNPWKKPMVVKYKDHQWQCSFCQVLGQFTYHEQYYRGWTDIGDINVRIEAGKPLFISLESCSFKDSFLNGTVVSKPFGTEVPSWPTLGGPAISPYDHAGSDSSINFCRQRLQECLDNEDGHALCKTQTSTLPLRVLDISNERVRLVDGGGLYAKYCTLSYRWGAPDHILCTTDKNFQAFCEDIPFLNLPNLIQDAIIVARKLDFKYLWVDSLCIVQDDEADWGRQSQLMGDYYGGSALTIAVASSASAAESFLALNPPLLEDLLGSREVDFLNSDGSISRITACGLRYSDSIPDAFTAPESSLRKRGWAWQEHLLSARILHFSLLGPVWECGSNQTFASLGCSLNFANSPIFRFTTYDETEERLYRQLVIDYSKRHLTYASDRLPAFSGVAARLFHSHGTDNEYLAGLRQSFWQLDLIWFSDDERGLRYSRDPTEIPTWSWGSICQPVFFEHWEEGPHSFSRETALIQTNCKPKSPNLYGDPLPNAYLDIEAVLLEVRVDINRAKTGHSKYKLSFKGGEMFDDFTDLMDDASLLVESQEISRGEHINVLQRALKSSKSSTGPITNLTASAWLLYMGRTEEHTETDTHKKDLFVYLVLTPTSRETGEGPEAFTRVGLVTTWTSPAKDAARKVIRLF